MASFTTQILWVDPMTAHGPKKPESFKIAAVSMSTDMVVRVYKNSIEAATKIVREGYLNFEPSRKLIYETARLISSAADCYHKEVLGYYWKWI